MISEYVEDVENDSGRRQPGFNADNELKIMNTHFEHRRIHKFTYQGRGPAQPKPRERPTVYR